MQRIEAKLDMLLAHLGLEYRDAALDSLPESVIEHVKAGNKIAAIREIRKESGMDLRTAKELVESLMS